MQERLENMSRAELEAELRLLKESLEDLEATFSFNLANTPDHLPAGMADEHEQELEEYRGKIAKVEALLREK